jgi:pimeloyl-ACP methyl ester carboxylesterase
METTTMNTVESADGTTIAFDRSGSGPAVVLLGGAFNDRSTTSALASVLAPSFTVYNPDRRGRGSSGDTEPYAVEREIEDVAALIAAAGGAAFVFGHSSGAALALEAAARGLSITKLAVYEPPYIADDSRSRPPADLADRLRALITADRRGDAVALFLVEAAAVPGEFVEMMRGDESWDSMQALAHTLPYDAAVSGPGQVIPLDRMASIAIPTLVLDGSESPEWQRCGAQGLAAAIGRAQHRTMDGQDHGVLHHPEVLVPVLTDFFSA